MSQTTDEIRAFGSGHIYVSDSNATPNFPASISTPITRGMGWIETGYASEDGVKFSFAREVTEIPAWQSFHPVHIIVDKIPTSVDFSLLQWNRYTAALALGGGTVSEPVNGEYLYEPPDPSFVDYRAVLIEGTAGDYVYRYCIRRALNKSGVEFSMVRNNASMLPCSFSMVAPPNSDQKPWFLQTDDPNFDTTDTTS